MEEVRVLPPALENLMCVRGNISTNPSSVETLELSARFVRKLLEDSIFADKGLPGLKPRNFSGRLAPITEFVQFSELDKMGLCPPPRH